MGHKQTRVGEGRWAKPGGCAHWGGAGVLLDQSGAPVFTKFPFISWPRMTGSSIPGALAPMPVSASGSSGASAVVDSPCQQTEPSTCVSLPCTGAAASLAQSSGRASLSR